MELFKKLRDDLLDDQLRVEQILEQVGALVMLSAEPGNGQYKRKYLSSLRTEITELILCIPVYLPPDWSKVPAWASWWAVAPNGVVMGFEAMPTIKNGIIESGWYAAQGFWESIGRVDLPIGCDWRLTLQQRPNPHAQMVTLRPSPHP